MNHSNSLFVIGTLLIASLSTAAVAKASETFLPPRPPESIEALHLPPNVERGVVRVRLVIDKSGHPQKIALLSTCDQAVETTVVTAVAKWQFTPATENGRPVEADVILPLHLVELSGDGAKRL